jgi:hypothetical protein
LGGRQEQLGSFWGSGFGRVSLVLNDLSLEALERRHLKQREHTW